MAGTGEHYVDNKAFLKALADYRIDGLEDKGLAGTSFTLQAPQGEVSIELALPGRHNAANALAAAALVSDEFSRTTGLLVPVDSGVAAAFLR